MHSSVHLRMADELSPAHVRAHLLQKQGVMPVLAPGIASLAYLCCAVAARSRAASMFMCMFVWW